MQWYISNSSLAHNYSNLTSVTDIAENYDKTLISVLDLHAPIKKKTITLRRASPWYTNEIHKLKITKRRLGRRWRATKSLDDRERYVKQCSLFNTAMTDAKILFYYNIIDESKNNRKVLFSTVDKMLCRTPEKLYPIYGVWTFFTETKLSEINNFKGHR